MNETTLIAMRDEIGKAIEKHVNGGIRALDKKITDHIEADAIYQEEDTRVKAEIKKHMDETRPYLEAATGIKRFGDFIIYMRNISVSIAGAAVAWYTFKSHFHI